MENYVEYVVGISRKIRTLIGAAGESRDSQTVTVAVLKCSCVSMENQFKLHVGGALEAW